MGSHIVRALRDYSTCDVADALLDLGVSNGGYLPGLTMWSPQRQEGDTRIAGPAWTVQYDRTQEGIQSSSKPASHYIDSAPAESIIFISCPTGVVSGCWGGLTTLRAKKLRVQGSIIDGNVRDLDEVRGAEYPVFARGVAVARPTGIYVSKVNEPVLFHQGQTSCTIRPGDLILADLCGTIVIPIDQAEAALQRVQIMAKAERIKVQHLQEGMTLTEANARCTLQTLE